MSEPPPLYHGTRTPFQRGGLLVPRSKHGGVGTTAPLSRGAQACADAANHVYATTSKAVAWAYAWHAVGRGRPRVLTVRPIGGVQPDPEHSAAMEAYRMEAAVVVAVDAEPMFTEAEARAGWVDA